MKHSKALLIYLVPEDSSYQVEGASEYDLQCRPKLGLMYLSSVLRDRRGISCEIWDESVRSFSLEQAAATIESDEYLFVGFYSAVSMEDRVETFVKELRKHLKKNVPIIVGGPSFPNAERFLRAGCDIVCNGEGEETVCEIVDYLKGDRKICDVRGVSYLKEGKVISSESRSLIKDVDSIPFPDYANLDMNAYHDYYIFTMRKPYTTMITSRGCPYDCSFCDSHGLWGRRYRVRSVDNVLGEIDYLVGKYGVRYIAFQDDVFGADARWADEFSARLKERNYDLRWMCILHPFSFRKDPFGMLKKLKSAGCDLISTGLQSADPEILKRLNRRPDEPQHLESLILAARRLGMLSLASFIFGSPGETHQTIKASIDYVMRIRPNYAKFYSMVVLPGSRLAKEYGTGTRLCDIDSGEIDQICRQATRRFFMDPINLTKNMAYVLVKNPAWFMVGCRHLFNLKESIGMGGKERHG